MGVIAETADRVAVMYSGRVVEIGPVEKVVRAPHHPYTKGLMQSIPRIGSNAERLTQIDGAMPRPDCPAHGMRVSSALPEGVRRLQEHETGRRGRSRAAPSPVTFIRGEPV